MSRREGLNGRLLSPSRMGELNRSRLLQAIVDHGPSSRADLAKMAGATRATIGAIVNTLLEAGVLEELAPDRTDAGVGKPARPLWFGERAGLTLAASVHPRSIDAALVNARGDLLDVGSVAVGRGPSGPEVVDAIAAAIASVRPARSKDLLGIGIAVPGVCDTGTGTVVASGQVPGLDGRPLAREVSAATGLDVHIDNDSRAQALGEKWFGAGRGRSSFAAIQTGDGLGLGLVLDGTIYRGLDGEAGELGHTTVVLDGERCRCGRTGCWETIATLAWLRAEARERALPGAARVTAATLAARADDGDGEAAAVLDLYADHLAVGLANVVNLLTVGSFILHGDAVGGGERLRHAIDVRVRSRVLPYLAGTVEIVLSPLDEHAALLGAAGLVLSETFNLTL